MSVSSIVNSINYVDGEYGTALIPQQKKTRQKKEDTKGTQKAYGVLTSTWKIKIDNSTTKTYHIIVLNHFSKNKNKISLQEAALPYTKYNSIYAYILIDDQSKDLIRDLQISYEGKKTHLYIPNNNFIYTGKKNIDLHNVKNTISSFVLPYFQQFLKERGYTIDENTNIDVNTEEPHDDLKIYDPDEHLSSPRVSELDDINSSPIASSSTSATKTKSFFSRFSPCCSINKLVTVACLASSVFAGFILGSRTLDLGLKNS